MISEGSPLRKLLTTLIKYNASDLHLKVGRPPIYRVNGKLIPAKTEDLTLDALEGVSNEILNDRQRSDLKKDLQVDLSVPVAGLGRFRCNLFFQKGYLSIVVRLIPTAVPQLDNLGLPKNVKEFCQLRRGLVLVGGPTGSGKSTTLAGMIQNMNEHRSIHILTLEDPIEFVFKDQKASVSQRELGTDMNSFKDGLRAGLRQDPDVIVISELRDAQTIQLALTAAETGHLVIASLHTSDTKSSIERVVDVFSPEARSQVRIQLASCLSAIICQQLVLKSDGKGRVPAAEILVKSPHVESLIQSGEFSEIPVAMENSSNYYNMCTFNQSLFNLVSTHTITRDEALKASNDPKGLELLMAGLTRGQGFDAIIKEDSVVSLIRKT